MAKYTKALRNRIEELYQEYKLGKISKHKFKSKKGQFLKSWHE